MTVDPEHLRVVEALLFAVGEPLEQTQIASRLPEGVDVALVLRALQEHYASHGVNVVQRGQAWAFRTAPDLAGQLVIEETKERKLSRAAVEVLAVIAYNQPVTRAEIEEIRGVALSKGTLDILFEAGWIAPRGRRRTPGRPLQWGTTGGFLDHFGLTHLEDLPNLKELKAAGILDTRLAAHAYANRAEAPGLMVDIDEPLGEGE